MNAFLLYYYLLIFLLCAGIYFIRSQKIRQALFLFFVSLQAICTFICGNFTVVANNYFKIDRLAVLFMAVTTILCLTHFLYKIFSKGKTESRQSSRLQEIAFILLIVSVNGLLLSHHLLVLCSWIEIFVFAIALLIYSNKESLADARKYFIPGSIGVSLALISIILIMTVNKEISLLELSITAIRKEALFIDPLWLKISFLLALSGCSVMMGVVPLFTPLVEAKENTSFQAGAIISGASTIAGFLAIVRFHEAFCIYPVLYDWVNRVFVITGLLSILFAAFYTTKITSFKKMLAYASLGNGGIVLIAWSMEREGYATAIIHLSCHAFLIAALFYQFGNTSKLCHSEDLNTTRNYFRKDPAGGTVILLAFLMLLAISPSGFAISEVVLVKSAVLHGKWDLLILTLVLLGWMFLNLAKKFLEFLYASSEVHPVYEKTAFYKMIPQILLLLLVARIGIGVPAEIMLYISKAFIHWF